METLLKRWRFNKAESVIWIDIASNKVPHIFNVTKYFMKTNRLATEKLNKQTRQRTAELMNRQKQQS